MQLQESEFLFMQRLIWRWMSEGRSDTRVWLAVAEPQAVAVDSCNQDLASGLAPVCILEKLGEAVLGSGGPLYIVVSVLLTSFRLWCGAMSSILGTVDPCSE